MSTYGRNFEVLVMPNTAKAHEFFSTWDYINKGYSCVCSCGWKGPTFSSRSNANLEWWKHWDEIHGVVRQGSYVAEQLREEQEKKETTERKVQEIVRRFTKKK